MYRGFHLAFLAVHPVLPIESAKSLSSPYLLGVSLEILHIEN